MISNNAILLSALAACALAAPSPSPNLSKRLSGPTELWKVPPRIDPNDPTKLAWKQVNGVVATIDVASEDGRLYSYYPATYNAGGNVFVMFSASSKDQDGMGQEVRISFRTNDGWTKPETAFPAALLPNQTTVETSEYYCKRGIPQRALQPLAGVYAGGGESAPKWYVVAQSSDNICPGSFQSAGRVARLLSNDGSGTWAGEPCWIETNDYTGSHQWAETVYGTKYQMKVCKDKDAIIAALAKPESVPAQATSLFNTPLVASDGKHNVSNPTNAVWIEDASDGQASGSGRYMRFWTDVSRANRTGDAWVEYSTDRDGKDWFPATNDGSKIEQTNIYSSWKFWFGGSDGQEQLRVFISNAGMTADGSQELLTVATSRGSNLTFTNIGVVRGGDANIPIPKGTRGPSNDDGPGFSWPSASFSGDELIVAYSENKAAIRVSTIKLSDLP